MNPNFETEKVIKNINKEIKELLTDEKKARACFCCNKILMREKSYVVSIDRIENENQLFILADEDVKDSLKADYYYEGKGYEAWMSGMMFSKNTVFVEKKETGFLSCSSCRDSLHKGIYPNYGIKNGWFHGNTPPELLELTDVEFASISPVRFYGHILSYYGGAKGIKGWHSLVTVDQKKVGTALHGFNQIEEIPNRIAVVLSGPFTARQKEKILKQLTIRRDKCLIAWEWLRHNNQKIADLLIDFDPENIPEPILIDKARVTDLEIDCNVELQEEFTVMFPDSTLNDCQGGQEMTTDLKSIVEQIRKTDPNNFQIASTGTQYTFESQGEAWVLAFLKQYPYGRGGPNEKRTDHADENDWKVSMEDYLIHVNSISNTNFHTQLFTLCSYNVLQKKKCYARPIGE